MNCIILFIIFFLGSIWGSFLGVIIERLVWQKGKWRLDLISSSHCLHCEKKLAWFDLIPIFSFIILGGKCRYCQKKIGYLPILIEVLSGLLFVGTFLIFGLSAASVFNFFLGSILLIIFLFDIKKQLVPDPLILLLFLLAIIKIIFNLAPVFFTLNLWNPLIGGLAALTFFLLLYFITRGKGMGLGDAKLGFVLGLFLGFKLSLFMLWFSFVLGAMLAIPLLLFGLKQKSDKIAFAPFLILSFLLIYFLPQAKVWIDALL